MDSKPISERLRRVAYEAHCLLFPAWMIKTIYEAAAKLENVSSGHPKAEATPER